MASLTSPFKKLSRGKFCPTRWSLTRLSFQLYVRIFSERAPEPTCALRRPEISFCCSSSCSSNRRERKICIARMRFFSCERSSVQKMRMPVGLCTRSTAVSTLFTFCPPAPPDRAVVRSMSLSSIFTSTSSTSGITATVAVEVCTRPCDSVAGTRCTRCTPASHLSCEYTDSPTSSTTISLYPPESAGFWLTIVAFHPSFCACLWYIFHRSPAQMPASSPPVPARISSMMFFSSRGSLGSSARVIFSSSASISPASSAASSRAISSISGSPPASLTICFASTSSSSHALYRAYCSTTPVSSPSALESFWNSLASDATSGSASRNVSSLCVCVELSSLSIRNLGAAPGTNEAPRREGRCAGRRRDGTGLERGTPADRAAGRSRRALATEAVAHGAIAECIVAASGTRKRRACGVGVGAG